MSSSITRDVDKYLIELCQAIATARSSANLRTATEHLVDEVIRGTTILGFRPSALGATGDNRGITKADVERIYRQSDPGIRIGDKAVTMIQNAASAYLRHITNFNNRNVEVNIFNRINKYGINTRENRAVTTEELKKYLKEGIINPNNYKNKKGENIGLLLGYIILTLSHFMNDIELLELLIEKTDDLNKTYGDYHQNILSFMIIYLNDLETFKKIYEKFENRFNIKDEANDRLLSFEYIRTDFLKYLIEKGINIDAKDENGNSCLMKLDIDILKELDPEIISNLVNVQNKDGKTAIMHADNYRQKTDRVSFFIDHGADLYIEDKDGYTVLAYWSLSLLKWFAENYDNDFEELLNTEHIRQKTLRFCVIHEEIDKLIFLIAHGVFKYEINDELLTYARSKNMLELLFDKGARIKTPEINDKLLMNAYHNENMLELLFDNGATVPNNMLQQLIKRFKRNGDLVKEIITKKRKEEYTSQIFNVYKDHEILSKCNPEMDIMSGYQYNDPGIDEDIYIIRDDIMRDTYRCYTLAEMKYMLDHGRKDFQRQKHIMSSDETRNEELWSEMERLVDSKFLQEENYCEYLSEISKDSADKKKVLDCLNYVTSEFPYRDSINWLMGPIASQFRGRGVETPLTIENLQSYINYIQEYMDIHFDDLDNLDENEAITYVASTILDYIVNSENNRDVIFNNLNVAFESLKTNLDGNSSPISSPQSHTQSE